MKILVADDSPVVRAAVTSLLAEAGFEVVTAEDGIDAIQKFYAELPDLVLLDIKMPRMSGYVACRLIKEDYEVAHTPVLILTALDSAEDRYWSQKSGADGYLTKESLTKDLVGVISSARATRALSELSRTDMAPKQLDNIEVLGRVAELLDRKLFDATIVNEIITMATRPGDLAGTLDEMLGILRRFVAYDVAAIALINERKMAVHFDSPVSKADLEEFRRLVAGHLQQMSGVVLGSEDFKLWLAKRPSFSEHDPIEGWPSFFAMALRSRGEVFGILAVADHRPGVYTPQVARTLRMVEFPIAAVVDAASHHQRLLEQEARLSLSSLYGDPEI